MNIRFLDSNLKFYKMISRSFILMFSLLFYATIYSQNDTITLKSGDRLVGELKLIDKGILTIETAYSDKDFNVEFNKVSQLIMQRRCLVILTDNRRRVGYIRSNVDEKITITLDDNTKEEFEIVEVMALQDINDKFIQRFRALIDLSYNYAKANKSAQFSIGGKLVYNSELWLFEGSVNTLNSDQEDADKTSRTEANIQFVRLMPRNLYLIGFADFLSNTEQAIDARISPSVGIGKFLASTNKLYFGLAVGFAFNIEQYVDSTLDKNSTEGFLIGSFNMFDVEDFDLETDIKFYPSISEKGRIRTDYNLSLKYDLPLDFYIKLGFSLNYDNKPAIAGSDVDYIFTSGFGWEFN